MINIGKLSITPHFSLLSNQARKNVIYLQWLNARIIDGSHYSANALRKIIDNSEELFNTVKIGMFDNGIEDATMKNKERSGSTMSPL